ncbi:MAG: universal stress protein [Myxococcales bacterium]|nr:universal stress protein [Myxococcales bacterium]
MSKTTHVMITTDLSDASGVALAAGADVAKRVGAKVTLVHVFDPMPMVPPMAMAPGYTLGENIVAEIRASIAKGLDRQKKEILGDVESVEIQILEGSSPARVACEFAESAGVDLIVVGTHGRKGPSRWILGSVAERIVRIAPCSVLVARAPEGSQ